MLKLEWMVLPYNAPGYCHIDDGVHHPVLEESTRFMMSLLATIAGHCELRVCSSLSEAPSILLSPGSISMMLPRPAIVTERLQQRSLLRRSLGASDCRAPQPPMVMVPPGTTALRTKLNRRDVQRSAGCACPTHGKGNPSNSCTPTRGPQSTFYSRRVR